MVRILVADDHPAYRDAVDLYLSRDLPEAQTVFIGTLGDIERQAGQVFDLVLLDWFLAGGDGGGGLEALAAAGIDAPVAILTGAEDPSVLFDALTRGAVGFLPKTLPRAAFVAAIRLLLAGGTTVPADLALAMAGGVDGNPGAGQDSVNKLLTDKEMAVLRELMNGGSNKEIGRTLGIQEITVKLHIRRMLKKLDARNRTDAVIKAQALGLIPTGETAR